MAKATKTKQPGLTKFSDVPTEKIDVFFKRSILVSIMKILTMEHSGFRTVKALKNINRVFSNINMERYHKSKELESYIWCIGYISKQWINGITNIDLIIEGAKRSSEYDNIKDDIITSCMNDKNIITAPEVKLIFDLIGEAIQYGVIVSMKEKYISLLDDINLDTPGAFKELTERLFSISQSLLDIRHNTNMVSNKITFNTSDSDSIRESISQTISSLSTSNNIFKLGIKRLNTLLSPGYMNGRIYVYTGLPGSGKSVILLKSALDIRKYNPNFRPKTPGMKPCVLYITMENTFTETIERIWNMTFDDNLANRSEKEAISMISKELGLDVHSKNDVSHESDTNLSMDTLLSSNDESTNIEIVVKYFPYREISTDDLFTIIQDLRDDNHEVCALVLDYIKRIRPSVSVADNVKLELNKIINELKALAGILDIPVITAHQMNRAAAATVDSAVRQGKGDVTKLVGRENIGDAWEICETADWAAVVNIEYKPGTDEKYMVFNLVKRRRIDSSEGDFAKYTYIAHPFAKNNGLRLIDDYRLDKILSLQSLSSDIDIIGKEKTNAVPRLKNMEQSEFIEF